MPPMPQKTILLVEDEMILALQEIKQLESANYRVVHAASGEKALEIVKTRSSCFDLVLMDIDLGAGIDGTEAAKEILQTYEVPLLFLSSHIEEEIVEKTEKVASYGYVVKNSSATVLFAGIKTALRLFEAQRQLVVNVQEYTKAEEILRTSNERHALILSSVNDGIWDWHVPSGDAFFSAIYYSLLGYEDGAFPANYASWRELVHVEDIDKAEKELNRCIENSESFAIDLRMRKKSGEWLWVSTRGKVVERDGSGKAQRIVGTLSDITNSKRIEQTQAFLLQCGLPSSGEDFFVSLARYLAETLRIDYVCIDRLGGDGLTAQTLAVYNDGVFEINTSYTLRDTPCGEVAAGRICSYPENVRRHFPRDKALQDLNAESYFGTALVDSRGLPIGLIALIGHQPFMDSTQAEFLLRLVSPRASGELELRMAAASARKSENLQRRMLANIGDVITVIDANGINKYKSPNIEKLFGWKPEELVGQSTWNNVHPDDLESSRVFIAGLALTPNAVGTREVRYKCRNGKYKWIQFTANNLLDDPDIRGILGNYHDITGRKLIEEALRESEARFKALHNASFGGIAIHDKGYILECNQGLCEMSGYTEDELIGMNGLDLIAEKFRDFVMGKIMSLNEQPYEAVGLRKNGDEYPMRLEGRNVPYKGKMVRTVEYRDITETRQAEKKIQNLLSAKEQILRETHHRLKNNMNTIYGLLALQAGSQTDETAVSVLSNAAERIQGMMLLYNKLYCADNIQEMRLKDFLSTLPSEIISANAVAAKPRLEVEIGDMVLDAKTLTSIGMLLNELICNSMKYAFADNAGSLISVKAVKNDSTVTFEYADNGCGLPEGVTVQNSTGFGMRLVGGMVEQLEGTLRIVRDKGTRFILEFKA